MDHPLLEVLRLRIGREPDDAVLRGMPLMLTAIERRLLRTLASDPTRIWVTPELLGQLWQRRSEGSIAVIDRTAARVRAVLDEVDPATRWLPHVWGVGYALVDPGEVKVVVMVRGLR